MISTALAFWLVGIFAGNTHGDVNIGLKADEDGIREFHLAIGDFYKAPENEVIAVRKRGIDDDELPVVFFLAARSGISSKAIIDLRLGGKSWLDISLHYGFGPEIYYIDVPDAGPPYGKALGHYKKKHKSEWHKIKLLDVDIVNLVNLKFLSKHHGYTPREIIKMRAAGESFHKINRRVKKSKAAKKNKAARKKPAKTKPPGKRKGKE
ncbi:MAG: hypothetical protein GY839_07455 [candidate division Zixibacteria bacterium]|nr:hypothetical protein [candidate division Zixibacteria bacterium]